MTPAELAGWVDITKGPIRYLQDPANMPLGLLKDFALWFVRAQDDPSFPPEDAFRWKGEAEQGPDVEYVYMPHLYYLANYLIQLG